MTKGPWFCMGGCVGIRSLFVWTQYDMQWRVDGGGAGVCEMIRWYALCYCVYIMWCLAVCVWGAGRVTQQKYLCAQYCLSRVCNVMSRGVCACVCARVWVCVCVAQERVERIRKRINEFRLEWDTVRRCAADDHAIIIIIIIIIMMMMMMMMINLSPTQNTFYRW